ncbi:hypothetical protein ACVWZA_004172 [Sphingomonas sp. UYAg733]
MMQASRELDRADNRHVIDGAMDRFEIRELLQNWVIWRDAGDWERFASVWHDDGRMIATWFRASAADFIAGCRKGFDAGVVGLHALGGISIDVQGARGVAQSKMQIVQRGKVDDVEVDVTCLGRFVDALEKRDGLWGIVLRQPVYELDRMTPVDPAAVPTLDPDLLGSFPDGYRHLAYLQTKIGFDVDKTLPGTRGPEIEALTGRMKRWLDGDDAACLGS